MLQHINNGNTESRVNEKEEQQPLLLLLLLWFLICIDDIIDEENTTDCCTFSSKKNVYNKKQSMQLILTHSGLHDSSNMIQNLKEFSRHVILELVKRIE